MQSNYTIEKVQQIFQSKTQQFFTPKHHDVFPFCPQYGEPNQDSASVAIFPVNFKLGLIDNNGNVEGVLGKEEEDEDLVHGSEQYFHNSMSMQPHCQEDSAFKQPVWKPSYTELLNSNIKLYNQVVDEEELLEKNQNKQVLIGDDQINITIENKCRLVSGLESMYGNYNPDETNQTRPTSVVTLKKLTKDDSLPENCNDLDQMNVDIWNSSFAKVQKRKKLEGEEGLVTELWDRKVKQLMDHQEGLHRKLLEKIERLEQERKERENAWRMQELAEFQRGAVARAHDRALASSREATIISCLEKITGQTINLPPRTKMPLNMNENVSPNVTSTSKRWPKAEVEALIRIRIGLESKFQEPGSKLTVWEEIRSSMASIGYQRSAQRCKEKWENINRYFKKVKENSKEFPHKQRRHCSYFRLLDQLYSKPFINGPSSSSTTSYCSMLQTTPNMGTMCDGFGSHGFTAEKVEVLEHGRHGKVEETHGVVGDKSEDMEEVEEEEEGDEYYSDGED